MDLPVGLIHAIERPVHRASIEERAVADGISEAAARFRTAEAVHAMPARTTPGNVMSTPGRADRPIPRWLMPGRSPTGSSAPSTLRSEPAWRQILSQHSSRSASRCGCALSRPSRRVLRGHVHRLRPAGAGIAATVVAAASNGRQHFSALHEFGHSAIRLDTSSPGPVLEEPDGGIGFEEDVCDTIAGTLLIPAEHVDARFGGTGPTARTVLDLRGGHADAILAKRAASTQQNVSRVPAT